IFKRAGIGHLTYLTFASGGSFSKFSHEFQTLTPFGEDTIYLDENSNIAINKEVYNNNIIAGLNLKKENLVEKRAVEVGNIFSLGTKFSEPFDLKYKDENGEDKLVVMGSYGIGLGRLMGTVVDVLAKSENEMIWPKEISPFSVHILEIKGKDGEKIKEMAESIYKTLQEKNIETLYDDRDKTSGEKFADADLIGIPKRIIIGKNFVENGTLEIIDRQTGKTTETNPADSEKLVSLLTH
ncbi:MAG: His/Gly/Thr/Pro-type tRNA ligase C-terminal domain-containing protein, partial [Patescibacteria group bacterium]